MNSSFDLDSKSLEMITQILLEHVPKAKAWLFGSRATGHAKPFSDVDILIDVGLPLSIQQLASLNTAFDESLLPYKVDIADARSISDTFKNAIDDQLIPLKLI